MMAFMGFIERMWGMVMVRDDQRIRQSFETWERNFLVSLFALSVHIYIFN